MRTPFWLRSRRKNRPSALAGQNKKPRRRSALDLSLERLEERALLTATITQWNFENNAIAVNNSPTPSTGMGTASGLGMTNSYNGTTSTNTDDVLKGLSGDTGTNTLADTSLEWRVRGQSPGNGWSSQAAIGTQGAEFAASTAGYTSINVSFDWYATTQGEGKLQLEYTTDGSTWHNVAITVPGADTSTTVHTNSSSSNTVMGSYVQVSGQNWSPNLTATIADPNAANDPNFAIELVNASTGADCVSAAGTALNNSSGNWRFDNVTISGTVLSAANAPAVDTPSKTSITNTSAVLGGTIESNTGAAITDAGIYYALTSQNSNPQRGGANVTKVDFGPVNASLPFAFTVPVSGLTSGAGYTFEAFATNSSGTTYTSPASFTTLGAPAVNSPTYSAITGNSATLGGNVASDGGSPVTQRGVIYAPTSDGVDPKVDPSASVGTASGTTGTFTLPVTGLSGATSYTFEAFATNMYGTTYSPPSSFTTAAPGIIAAWTFPALAGAGDNSPAPTYGTGTATTLGMTNSYNGGNTTSDDVVSTSGTADSNFTENTWRVRGTGHNGWATFQNGAGAPQYTQGIELDTSTVGYSNIVFSFDWYSTTQGIRDLQVQYNTGSGWVNYQGPSPTGTFVTGGNDYYNSALSPANPTIYVNLTGVPAASNNANLGIRLVSAFDSTGTLGNEYASATSTPGDVVPYNNSSGNWRFGNLIFYGNGTTTTTTLAASPGGSQDYGQNVTVTATVTPAGGSQYPTGTVNFYDGPKLIGTEPVSQVGTTNVGTAVLSINNLPAGIQGDITAQYAPAAGNYLIASGSSMNLQVGDPTDNPISYVINAPQATGVDVSPVAGQSFSGVVTTFTDGIDTNPSDFTATITWGDGHTTSTTDGHNDVAIAFVPGPGVTNISGAIVGGSLFTVASTNTYAAPGVYPMSVTITDAGNNSATVNPSARVAYAPLAVTPVAVNAVVGKPLANVPVATFTDPAIVALGLSSNPGAQFSANIDWGDGTTADNTGTIAYDSVSQTFSVLGSHTYSQAASYPIKVTVTPLTVSVERMDSSDPNALNLVGDENGNGLTDSPSPDFIDQYSINATGQAVPLYTTSLPTVANFSGPGNEALTNSSYSISEGELTLSTNGQYLVTAGYNDTVSTWAPQQTFSAASVLNRVIGTVDGAGKIDTTTDLTDAYNGDNFRGVVSTDGTQFWTSGNATDTSNFVHYAQHGAGTSTIITGPSGNSDINTVEIFNGQLYEGVRSVKGGAAGIYQVGTGLPTMAGQSQTLFIQVPQSNPLDVNASNKPMSPFGFYMADVSGEPTDPNSGENVVYIADGEMGIARYDYNGSNWRFSYYIDKTGSIQDSAYSVNSDGSINANGNFSVTNPPPVDSTKLGGVRELTGRVVNGQVQLFAVTGFGDTAQPIPGNSLIEVTDPASLMAQPGFLNTGDNIVTLATDSVPSGNDVVSAFTGVAFTPYQTITSSAQVSQASPTITSDASPTAPLGGTLTDNALVANGYYETGSLVFTLTGPGGSTVYTTSDTLSGNGTYYASYTLPATGAALGTYTWHVSYAGDPNNNGANDQGGTFEQAVVGKAEPTITTTPSPNVTLGTTTPTLSDNATLAGGYNPTGSLLFTLTGPNGFTYTQTVPITGNGNYSASDTLPTTGTVAGTYNWSVSYAGDANNYSATDNPALGQLGDVFYIDMENHNLAQPSTYTAIQPLYHNSAAPYLNSLMTPGNPNAVQTSWASAYQNAAPGIHPSEPNYIWQEGGSNYGVLNDDDPYKSQDYPNYNVDVVANTGNDPANLSGLLQAAGISWKSYQEGIDLVPSSGSVNQPGANSLTNMVAPQSQWTVPTSSFSGASNSYVNPYNGSHQYNFAVKHDGTLFYTDTNGGTLGAANFSPSNPEAQYYAPLEQLQTDLSTNTVARYNLITPDQYNDMHTALTGGFTYNGIHYTGDSANIAQGDNFLSIIVPQIMASQAYKNNGAIVIWYDETEGGDTSATTLTEIVISPLAKGNAYNSTQVYTHSSDLKTLQELFGVSAPGGGFLAGANTPGTNDLSDMFKSGEQTVVSKASPTIVSDASPAAPLGGTLTDNVLLANGYYETGSLVFTLTGPGGSTVYTTSDTLSGNGTYYASYTLSATGAALGTYTWHVSYAGDPNNNGASDQGGTFEQAMVSKAQPTITTTPSPNVTLGTTAPTLSDNATLAGGYNPTGSLLFTLTGPSGFTYSQTVPITGNGTYTASDVLPTTGTVAGTYNWSVSYAGDANNYSATDNPALGQLGDVFYIDMENHNLVQPTGLTTSPEQLLGNPAAPYLNSLMTPGNPNAAQTSYASNYYNVLYNNPAVSIHPSEPNYVWQEGGSNYGVLNDDDPYKIQDVPNYNVNVIANTGNDPANLSGLLQAAGVSWKSYQEDIDLATNGGKLTYNTLPQSQWTVPTSSMSGTSAAYTNAYNGSQQYNYAVKHDGSLFFTDTNGGTTAAPDLSPSNPETQYYAPLQQFQTDLNNNTVSRYNLITPDQYNDMHSSLNTNFTYNGVTYTHNTDQESIALGDNFLSQIVPQIEASQAYQKNGVIVIWYDETEGGNTTAYTVPEIIISPLAKGNAYNSTQVYTHSSDLKTLQELFGVSGPSGGFLADANTPGTNDLSDMFKTGEQTVVSKASPTINSTASPAVAVGPTAPTLNDTVVLANGYFETGNLVFTLVGPGGSTVYTQTDPLNSGGNGTYTASDALPSTTASGTYTWHVSYVGDPNNNAAQDQGGAAEQTVVVGAGSTVVGNALYLVGGNTNDQVNLNPVGTSNTGSTGIQVQGRLDGVNLGTVTYPNATYPQPITAIYIVGFNGNDNITEATTLNIPTSVSEGNGNDNIQLGNGNDTVVAGNGNDNVQLGNGGSGDNPVTGIYSANIVMLGNGNDNVMVGNGSNIVTLGSGNNNVQAGNGNNLIAGGTGHDNIQAGNGNNILIDGSVQASSAVLKQVLNDWANNGVDDLSTIAAAVTLNTKNANTLHAGTGHDWFFAAYGKDNLNNKQGDLVST